MVIFRNKILIVIIVLGALLRFYDLDWGEGFFFHPDEYHIGSSVNQMSFPQQMHPHFFSYGTFISYLIYFSKEVGGYIGLLSKNINPILIGRFYSALFSTITIPVIFQLTRTITKRGNTPLLIAGVASLSPGLIQQAHFATPESLLIFWVLLSLLFVIYFFKNSSTKFIILSAVSFGAALSIKISGLIFLPVHLLAILLSNKQKPFKFSKMFLHFLSFILMTFVTFFLIYPYSILDWNGFRHSMKYETGVGRGDPLVFYTRQFINTTPILFQFTKILPYVMDPITLIFGTLSVFYSIYVVFKKESSSINLIILLAAFLIFFVPSSFLFAKWTRFIVPAIPFFIIFSGFIIDNIKKINNYKFACIAILSSTFIWIMMFFQIYRYPDVRVQANEWIKDNLPQGSTILTEAGNMVEVPLSNTYNKHSFDFYHLDENPLLKQQLVEHLVQADIFIVQSRRIYYNHQRLPHRFPLTATFYNNLFSGNLGFTHIKTFTAFPTIPGTTIRIVDEYAEETWTVFDHPVVRIYAKSKQLTNQEYEELLGI